jgi:phosphate starvation-inducible membrane PsiE
VSLGGPVFIKTTPRAPEKPPPGAKALFGEGEVSCDSAAMSQDSTHAQSTSWPSRGAYYLGRPESAVLILIGVVLVALAVLLIGSSVMSLVRAVTEAKIREEAIEILDSVLLVMMTMEIVYTVAISLESHTLVAEPFLIIGAIAAIRRMLVITATSTKDEHSNPEVFRNTLIELGLLSLIVIAMAISVYILRKSSQYQLEPPRHDHDS